MNPLFQCIQKAKHSKSFLWILNRIVNHVVPFNKPHGFSVLEITPTQVKTTARYRKKNFNHVKGIHACAIATIGELSAGLLLMNHFSPNDFRFILSNLQVDYHYQAKKDLTATATLAEAEKEKIVETLKTQEKTLQSITTQVHDSDQRMVATVLTTWQIKPWSAVKTKK